MCEFSLENSKLKATRYFSGAFKPSLNAALQKMSIFENAVLVRERAQVYGCVFKRKLEVKSAAPFQRRFSFFTRARRARRAFSFLLGTVLPPAPLLYHNRETLSAPTVLLPYNFAHLRFRRRSPFARRSTKSVR